MPRQSLTRAIEGLLRQEGFTAGKAGTWWRPTRTGALVVRLGRTPRNQGAELDFGIAYGSDANWGTIDPWSCAAIGPNPGLEAEDAGLLGLFLSKPSLMEQDPQQMDELARLLKRQLMVLMQWEDPKILLKRTRSRKPLAMLVSRQWREQMTGGEI